MPRGRKYHFSTKNLVTIAVLASLGGALSAYIGYLGNLVNRVVGVPFGAGQFMAGLHVIWIMLAIGIICKKGAGTATGILKGFIELFLGSTHGIVILAVSSCQGLVADLALFSDKLKRGRGLIAYSIAGALSSASNVFVFQSFYFSGVPGSLMILLAMLAAGSGMIFGGWLTIQLLDSLEHGGIIEPAPTRTGARGARAAAAGAARPRRSMLKLASVSLAIIFLSAFTIGGVYYFSAVHVASNTEGVKVTGSVENDYMFEYSDFEDDEVTIKAELQGSYTHVPARNYTGIPLNIIITKASARPAASTVTVLARDGYSMDFNLDALMTDDMLIITCEDGNYALVAANYDGAYWVHDIYKLEVS